VLAASIAALVLAAVLGYLWYRRREPEATEPPLPPWEIAYKRIDALKQRGFIERGEIEPFYVDLTAILRYYVEGAFDLHAPEQTTPEFLEVATQSGVLTDDQQETLARFLRHCDRVKFVRYQPTTEQMNDGIAFVHWFVEETKAKAASAGGETEPAEPPAAAAGAA